MHCEFEQVTTSDGIDLQGLIFLPKDNNYSTHSEQTPTVVGVWVHGLISSFHSNYKRITTLARVFNEQGMAFATFDTRGHDVIAAGKHADYRRIKGYRSFTIGSAYEQFDHCDRDLEAIVKFLKKKFARIVLIGHSTGANKVLYYATRRRFKNIPFGLVLLAPVSDVPVMKKEMGKNYEEALRTADEMVKSGKGMELIPRDLVQPIYTAQRFLSLASQQSVEQMFPSKDFKGPLRLFSLAKIPMMVVIGEKDQYLDLPLYKLIETLVTQTTSVKFSPVILRNADHGFDGKEEELADTITTWIKGLN